MSRDSPFEFVHEAVQFVYLLENDCLSEGWNLQSDPDCKFQQYKYPLEAAQTESSVGGTSTRWIIYIVLTPKQNQIVGLLFTV